MKKIFKRNDSLYPKYHYFVSYACNKKGTKTQIIVSEVFDIPYKLNKIDNILKLVDNIYELNPAYDHIHIIYFRRVYV